MVTTAFDTMEIRSELKRKRIEDEDGDESLGSKSSNKRNIAQLPIRSPPQSYLSRPLLSTVTSPLPFVRPPPGTLTPVDSSEDESKVDHDDEVWSPIQSGQRPHSNSQTSTASSSVLVQVESRDCQPGMGTDGDTNMDVDMDVDTDPDQPRSSTSSLLQTPNRQRIGRARSNDILSPVREHAISLLRPPPPTTMFMSERVPTPVASSFGARNPYDNSFVRPPLPSSPSPSSSSAFASSTNQHYQHYQHHRTSLSPMIGEESWASNSSVAGPPSPAADDTDPDPGLNSGSHVNPDSDVMMVVEDASNSFNALSMAGGGGSAGGGDDLDDYQRMSFVGYRRNGEPDITSSAWAKPMTGGHSLEQRQGQGQDLGRTRKLHLGYRSDCEKCVQKVPGHYSHILWS